MAQKTAGKNLSKSGAKKVIKSNKKSVAGNAKKKSRTQGSSHSDSGKSRGVFVMLIGLILALWFGVIYANTFGGDYKFVQILTRSLSGLFNIAIALLIVYLGLLMFKAKTGRLSGWQLAGWFCFFFAVLGMLHLNAFAGGIKTFASIKAAFSTGMAGGGGGICGFFVGGFATLIPTIKARYVVLAAIAILGLMLGTDMKIFSYFANAFKDTDPDTKANRLAKKQAKADAKAQRKAESKAVATEEAEQRKAQRLEAENQAALEAKLAEQTESAKLSYNEANGGANRFEKFSTKPDYSNSDYDYDYDNIVRDAKPKDFLEPPLITDYSGKMFEEITDFDAVTVGDLLGEDDYNDPQYIQEIMPRVSTAKDFANVSQKDLEQFADLAVNKPHPESHSLVGDSREFETENLASMGMVANNPDNLGNSGDNKIDNGIDNRIDNRIDNGIEETIGKTTERGNNNLANQHIAQFEKQKPEVVATHAHTSVNSFKKEYKLPPLSLLKGGINVKNPRMNKQIMDNSIALENTLASFGVKTKVVEVVCGPSVIRYELQPAPGVKVSKIVNLADDIALALAAKGLRIEAPVSGKSVVGIEIAKSEVNPVFFKDVLASERFAKSQSKISIAFGVDINGNPVIGNLADMPHLLIAGATGSGKSVCMNTLICSILYKAKPDEVKIIMIDPKKVELSNYNGLPHLGKPVVTDSKKAAGVLREVVNEMERRYTVFASSGVKNFAGFNELPDVEKMPQIVVLIDELADLMMVASRDVEDAICRLAQMARAAGIHLVIATQRPSVDVITGLIKANVPSRIAFAVSSQIDSRTILDMGGAEKLLGKGDMLYFPIGNQKPIRVQGAFLSEAEIEKLVDYCSKQAEQEFIELPSDNDNQDSQSGGPEEDDELFLEACRQVIVSGQASASSLQRRFRIGYNRAARLIETMEEFHIISRPEGNKRTVLIGSEMFEGMFGNQKNNNQDMQYKINLDGTIDN